MTNEASRIVPIGCMLVCLCATGAHAQPFSNTEGYSADGNYRVQVELVPYGWLPATSATVHLGRPDAGHTISVNVGVPSVSEIASSLDAAIIGAGLVRYGPWSAEIDLQWVNANTSTDRPVPNSVATIHTNEGVSIFRVAPGLGYEVFAGSFAGLPASLDVRAGFAYITSGASADPAYLPVPGFHVSKSFVQPWLGMRFDVYASRSWRIELGALAQGFGVDGGSWGWGASAIVSYLIADWVDVSLGFRALNTQRFGGRDAQRSLNLTEYGPLLGVGFRF